MLDYLYKWNEFFFTATAATDVALIVVVAFFVAAIAIFNGFVGKGSAHVFFYLKNVLVAIPFKCRNIQFWHVSLKPLNTINE